MDIFRIEFDKNFGKSKISTSIRNLKIVEDIRKCLEGLIDINPDDYRIIVPFNKDFIIEIYAKNVDCSIEIMIKRFFKEDRVIRLIDVNYTIARTKLVNIIWIPRLLKGYGDSRINTYKTVNPIFYKNLFDNLKYCDKECQEIDEVDLKDKFTANLINEVSRVLNIKESNIVFEWEIFNITFAKHGLEDKNQICCYGTFRSNCLLPFFLGDFTERGYGKLHLVREKEKLNTATKNIEDGINVKIDSSLLEKLKQSPDIENYNNDEMINFVIADYLLKNYQITLEEFKLIKNKNNQGENNGWNKSFVWCSK